MRSVMRWFRPVCIPNHPTPPHRPIHYSGSRETHYMATIRLTCALRPPLALGTTIDLYQLCERRLRAPGFALCDEWVRYALSTALPISTSSASSAVSRASADKQPLMFCFIAASCSSWWLAKLKCAMRAALVLGGASCKAGGTLIKASRLTHRRCANEIVGPGIIRRRSRRRWRWALSLRSIPPPRLLTCLRPTVAKGEVFNI